MKLFALNCLALLNGILVSLLIKLPLYYLNTQVILITLILTVNRHILVYRVFIPSLIFDGSNSWDSLIIEAYLAALDKGCIYNNYTCYQLCNSFGPNSRCSYSTSYSHYLKVCSYQPISVFDYPLTTLKITVNSERLVRFKLSSNHYR